MECVKCGAPAPKKVLSFSNKWTCPDCCKAPTKLIDALKLLYNSGVPGRYVYVSELSNNLSKVKNSFIEGLELNNPYCTIYLTLPDGVPHLSGKFDTIFIDSGFASTKEVQDLNLLEEFGEVMWVDPTSMEIDHDSL